MLIMGLTIFFLVYLILSITRHYKKGYKAVLIDMLETPLRLLLALVAIYSYLNEQYAVAIIAAALLFINAYRYAKKDRDDIKQLRSELKELRAKRGKK